MLGSPAGQAGGGTAQRGLWPLAPAPAPSSTSFTTDGFGKYGIYSLLPGAPTFGSTIYSHSSIGRFATAGPLQAPPGTSFHTSHKDSLFTSGYTFGAPTPPPGSPYSPIPVTQLELLTKGFNSNIIIQQPEYTHHHQQQQPQQNKLQIKKCDDKCLMKQQKSSCNNCTSPSKTKFLDSPSGCSRTNPVDWGNVSVKKEPGLTPCQVAEITTSLSPIIKIEQASPTLKHCGDVQITAIPNVTSNGNIPVGIAVARQRIQHEVSSPGLLSTYNSTHIKEISRISDFESGMAANVTAGVPGGGTLLHCTTDERQTPAYATWPLQATHNSAFQNTPTLWQYPGALPMESMVPMSMPMPPVGYQLVRDHTTGGLLLLPTTGMEQLQQTVVWPSYGQQQSHVLLPPLPPPPLQLISSASDYLQTSSLHQHSQSHSTRLLAVTSDHKTRKLTLPTIPTTTYIKIETSDASMDNSKALQAVSTIANNTGTVYTDPNMLTTHVIYQHPNLILSQASHGGSNNNNEGNCREQATSPVAACLTPPPEALPLEEETRCQDASNQTDTQDYEIIPTNHSGELKCDDVGELQINCGVVQTNDDELLQTNLLQISEVVQNNLETSQEVSEMDDDSMEIDKRTNNDGNEEIVLRTNENIKQELHVIKDVLQPVFIKNEAVVRNMPEIDECLEQNVSENVTARGFPRSEKSTKPDLSGLELLSNSIAQFENYRRLDDQKIEDARETHQNDVLSGIAQMTLTDEIIVKQKLENDELGGLDLLCALAEQRIMEEGAGGNETGAFKLRESTLKVGDGSSKLELKGIKQKKERKRERRLRKRYSLDLIKHDDETKDECVVVDEKTSDLSYDAKISDTSFKMCTCIDNYKTYKTKQSEEEARKFIRSKSQTLCCKGDWPCMNANELNIRMNLADLQRKYKEKQKELSKLKPKKLECLKKNRIRKKSINSDRSTPPPLLDKMDVPLKTHKTLELLKPPTLCPFEATSALTKPQKFNLDLLASSASIVSPFNMAAKSVKTTECETNDIEQSQTQTPPEFDNQTTLSLFKKRHSSPSWTDLSDSSPEKSSKKRKVGRPRKLSREETTKTLVSKKPKNLVGYVLAAKEKLVQNKNVGLYDSPPRFIDNQSRSREINSAEKKHNKSKIRPKLKAEPTIKSYTEDEEAESSDMSLENEEDEEQQDIANVEELTDDEIAVPTNEEIHEDFPQSGEDDKRCILTTKHLEMDKSRVLTAMGGLFYAGHLNAVEPPDVYSITLDGERGNRPHIMSREEILRDAIVEVSPGSTAELPPGTRLCAYWSQQYRCLYPGSVAEPEEATDLDVKFVSVEFDDGDSGRIAIEDIRLLPVDYPIIEYDPNPLLSLSKRRRRTSMNEERRFSQSTPPPILEPLLKPSVKMEKENKDINKPEDATHRDRKRLKKRKREKLKQKLAHDTLKDRKKRKKHKCNDVDNCRHKKHHKKHRKHKKHHHAKDNHQLLDDNNKDFGDNLIFPEYHIISNSEGIIGGNETKIPAKLDVQIKNDVPNNKNKINKIKNTSKSNKYVTLTNDEDSTGNNDNLVENNDIIGNPEDEVTMDDILEAKTTKKAQNQKLRDRQESCESSRSKMSAFLPARQLWGWSGKGYKRPKGRGRIRKEFFKEIQRGKETISIGDSAVFLSTGRPDRPYIGRIEAMWETAGTMVVKVKWFYHPEETIGCPLNLKYPGALFESPHVDENDVQTISHKCNVLPLKQYTNKLGDDPRRYATIYDNNDIYYLAGYYDPTSTTLKLESDIPFNNTQPSD